MNIKIALSICSSIFSLLLSSPACAQDFFDDEDADTVVVPFYEQNRHLTACFVSDPLKMFYGASLLVHFNKEKLSPYFDVQVNGGGKKTLSGLKITPTLSSRGRDSVIMEFNDTSYSFSAVRFSVGLASALTPKLMAYGHLGSQYLFDSFGSTKEVDGTLYRTSANKNFDLRYGAGIFYVFPFQLTAQLGVVLPDLSFIAGLGCTF